MVKGALFLFVIILLSLVTSAAPEAQAETKAVTLQVFCCIPKYLEFPPPIEEKVLSKAENDTQINEQTSENFSEEIHSRHTRYQGNQKEVIHTIIER
ncbi:MAG: hypothetical protein V1662_05885 [Candidatus Omnitrophota bacterium]